MKKIIMTLLAATSIAAPTIAHTLEEDFFNTYTAMGCMKLLECDEGIYEVKPGDYSGEADRIIRELHAANVEVYEAIGEYFVDDYRAVYYSDVNRVYINLGFIEDDDHYLELLRHEGWHAAQDCYAGNIMNSDLIHMYEAYDIPGTFTEDALDRYGLDPFTIRVEREALWAGNTPNMTLNALKVCNSNQKMWEVYTPPERSKSWLYINGHL